MTLITTPTVAASCQR
ncbi:hypothetical protein [uncultured Sulfitobacter sp.]